MAQYGYGLGERKTMAVEALIDALDALLKRSHCKTRMPSNLKVTERPIHGGTEATSGAVTLARKFSFRTTWGDALIVSGKGTMEYGGARVSLVIDTLDVTVKTRKWDTVQQMIAWVVERTKYVCRIVSEKGKENDGPELTLETQFRLTLES